MKRPLLAVLAVALVALAAWELPLLVARWVVLDEAPPAALVVEDELELDGLVDEVLAPSVLADASLITRSDDVRQDERGSWIAHRSIWKLPEGDSAPQVARRLESVLEEVDDRLDAYVTTDDELDADVRIYAGKRLVAHPSLEPPLGAPPDIESGRPPLLAVVVTGLGREGSVAETLMASPVPFSVALEPFAPFTLRLSRTAVLHHKEVLIDLHPDHELVAALEAVPYASGVLVTMPPDALPADTLVARDLYVLDGTDEVEAAALRTARNAGVAVLSADVLLDGDPGPSLQRARHLAALHGEVVVVVDVDDEARSEVFRWLAEVRDDLRLAFVTEVLDVERLGLDAPE